MKLGSQTGSVTNHIMSRMTKGEPKPFAGMPCTILCWTDRHGATIVDVLPNGVIAVQTDKATRVDTNGMSESQKYTYERRPNGGKTYFRKAKTGAWQEVMRNVATKRWNKVEGHGLRLGERDEYHDFSF